jgi:hypothetical protein
VTEQPPHDGAAADGAHPSGAPRPRRRRADPAAGFDRLRPRSPQPEPLNAEALAAPADQEGRRALFSEAAPPASLGAITISCSSCGRHTVVSARQALLLALPSLHLPYLRPGHGSWMRCPACGRRTWVSVRLKL